MTGVGRRGAPRVEVEGCCRAPMSGPSRARVVGLILLVLGSLLPALAPNAVATPAVTFQMTALPIPGFPGTGDILGAGAEVETQMTISGTEYGGFPSPLTGLNLYAPAGAGVDSAGFPACEPSALEADGPEGCPKKSIAGAPGVGLGVVAFGGNRVPESVSIRAFFAPGGDLSFYVVGETPTSFQVIEKAHWVPAGAPFGQEVLVEVPLVETVPDGPDASILSFKVKVGAAYRRGKRTVSYITLPNTCPRGGFPVKAELKFLSGEIVTVPYRAPCPKHRTHNPPEQRR
jgi:hypothetical protein